MRPNQTEGRAKRKWQTDTSAYSLKETLSEALLEVTTWIFFFFSIYILKYFLRDECGWVAWIMSEENGSCDDQVPNHVVSLPSATGSSWQCFCPLDPPLGEHTNQMPQSRRDQPGLPPSGSSWDLPRQRVSMLPGSTWRGSGRKIAVVIGRGSLEAVSQILVVWHLVQQYYLNTAESWRVQDSSAKEMALIPKQSKKRPQAGC